MGHARRRRETRHGGVGHAALPGQLPPVPDICEDRLVAEDLRRAYKQRFEADLDQEDYQVVRILDDLTPDRRAFLAALGGGVLLLVSVRAQDRDLPVRVQLTDDGRARAFTGKMEMGQGARTLLTQAFAEELGLPVDRVDLVMGDTALCPDDGGTWASITTPQTVPVIRKAAAAMRARGTGGSADLTPPAQWRTMGTSVRHVQGPAIVTGRRRYPSDLRTEGLQHAVVVRAPHHKARLRDADTRAAAAIPGVRIVRDGDLIAAVASTERRAREAAGRVHASWTPEPLTPQATWPDLYRKTAVPPTAQPQARYPPLLERGDVTAAMRGATTRRSSTYWVDPIAHVPLEPRAAVATWDAASDSVTVLSGAQAPFLVRQEVARALGIAETRVRIIVSDSGGGFGGKQRGECEVEAARVARAAGVPIRMAWTREEEFTCSYTRPAGLIEVESALDDQRRVAAMRFTTFNAGPAGLRPQYEIAHHWIGACRTQSDVRQGSYRSLAATANNFALESHMDEWAVALDEDPVAFRLRHIDDVRLREVVQATTRRFGWSTASARPRGRGIGFACNLEKDARLALCVEVEVTDRDVRVLRMVATGDFGAALNPDALQHQMSGALIQGLGGALWERVTFDTTSQQTRRLRDYRVPRFRDLPHMDVQILDRRDVEPAGAGESPITLTAPAVAAAIASATGQRRTSLPLTGREA